VALLSTTVATLMWLLTYVAGRRVGDIVAGRGDPS
jgi:hypothetical protein